MTPTNKIRNPKHEIRNKRANPINPKSEISQTGDFEAMLVWTFRFSVIRICFELRVSDLVLSILLIWICFEFRFSIFEFIILVYPWRPLRSLRESSYSESRIATFDPPSSIFHPRSSILDLPSSIFHPRSSILHPRSSFCHPRFSTLDSQSSACHPAARLFLG
jgi:hypothetical protein